MIIYVSCADDAQYDQVLEEFIVSPLPKGMDHKQGQQMFEMSVQPPDFTKIPLKDVLGVTIMMITAMYRRQEFFRCSYFVYNNYTDDASICSRSTHEIEKVVRSILIKEPRIRINEILWDYPKSTEMVEENLKFFSKVAENKNKLKKRVSKKPKKRKNN